MKIKPGLVAALWLAISLFYFNGTFASPWYRTCNFAPDTISYTPANSLCPGGTLLLKLDNLLSNAVITWYLNNIVIPGGVADTLTINALGSYSAKATYGSTAIIYPALTINGSIIPVAGFINTPGGGCSTTSIKFTNTSTGTGLVYHWNFGDPNSGKNDTSSLANPDHFFIGNHGNGTQTFIVTLTAGNAAGCTGSPFTSLITVKQSASTNLQGTGAANYNGLPYFISCSNMPSVFSFTNNSGTDNVFYTINWGDKSPGFKNKNLTTIDHTYSPGVYTLFFSVTGINGCTNTESYYVFVGTTPKVTVSRLLQNVICANQPLVINLNGLNQNSKGTTYIVSYPNGVTAKYQGPIDTLINIFKFSSLNYTATTSTGTFNNAYTVSITASNPCGTSTADAGPIYVSDPQPAAFLSNPANGFIYVNNVVSFVYQGALGNTITSTGNAYLNKLVWQITPASGYAPNNDIGSDNNSNDPQRWTSGSVNPSVMFNKAGKYVITLKAGNTGCGIDSQKTMVCVDNPALASFTASALTVCSGSSVQFSNTSLPGICGIKQYLWAVTYTANSTCPGTNSFNFINASSANSQNPDIEFDNEGIYHISLVVTNPDKTISPVYSKDISVTGLPIIKIVIPDTLCAGSALTPSIIVTNCGAAPILSYQWYFAGATPSSSNLKNPPLLMYNTSGSHQIKLITNSACGFSTDSVNAFVNPELSVINPGDRIYCSGVVVPAVSLTRSFPNEILNWVNDNGAIGLNTSGTGDIPSFTSTNNSNAAITANISITPNTGSCSGTPVAFKITIGALQTVPLVNSPQNICLNSSSGPLIAIATTGNTLSWYTDKLLSNKLSAAPVPATNSVQSVNYYVTQTNANGCESLPAVIVVNIIPPIDNNRIGSDQIVCFSRPPQPLSSDAAITGGTGSYSYQWQVSLNQGSSWDDIRNGVARDYTPVNSTGLQKYRRFVASGSCVSLSNEVTVTFQPEISDYQLLSGNQLITKNSTPQQITAQQVGSDPVIYQWESSLDGISYTYINNANLVNYQPGELSVTTFYKRITIIGVCFAISSAIEIEIKDLLMIPNAFTPNGDGINDEWVIKGFENDPTVSLKVFNRYGSIVLDAKNRLPAWNGTYNGQKLPVGTYYYILSAQNYKATGYVVIIY